jgi:hypothetical protein
MSVAVSESEFANQVETNGGFCTTCKEFTANCCEPDARRRRCEVCGKNTVYGAEEALLRGFVGFDEEEVE